MGVTLLETPVEAYASPITIDCKKVIISKHSGMKAKLLKTTHLIIFANNIRDHNHD